MIRSVRRALPSVHCGGCSVRLSFDPVDPPADPPAGADPLMWRLAYALHREHQPEWEGPCRATSCRNVGARWPCPPSKLAEVGLVTAVGSRAPWSTLNRAG